MQQYISRPSSLQKQQQQHLFGLSLSLKENTQHLVSRSGFIPRGCIAMPAFRSSKAEKRKLLVALHEIASVHAQKIGSTEFCNQLQGMVILMVHVSPCAMFTFLLHLFVLMKRVPILLKTHVNKCFVLLHNSDCFSVTYFFLLCLSYLNFAISPYENGLQLHHIVVQCNNGWACGLQTDRVKFHWNSAYNTGRKGDTNTHCAYVCKRTQRYVYSFARMHVLSSAAPNKQLFIMRGVVLARQQQTP